MAGAGPEANVEADPVPRTRSRSLERGAGATTIKEATAARREAREARLSAKAAAAARAVEHPDEADAFKGASPLDAESDMDEDGEGTGSQALSKEEMEARVQANLDEALVRATRERQSAVDAAEAELLNKAKA